MVLVVALVLAARVLVMLLLVVLVLVALVLGMKFAARVLCAAVTPLVDC